MAASILKMTVYMRGVTFLLHSYAKSYLRIYQGELKNEFFSDSEASQFPSSCRDEGKWRRHSKGLWDIRHVEFIFPHPLIFYFSDYRSFVSSAYKKHF